MKIIIFISFCILLIQTGFCEEEAPGPYNGEDTTSLVEQEPVDSEDNTDNDIDEEQETTASPATTDNNNDDDKEVTTVESLAEMDAYLKKQGILIKIGGGCLSGYGSGGNTYTRWGRTVCPRGATKVYDGYAAAGRYNQKGNGANLLCMPKTPQYVSTTSIPWPSCLYPAEYETNNRIFSRRLQNENTPCAVCHIPRSAKIMVPGRVSCPSSWTREYYGYTMAGHMGHYQTINYECVDIHPEIVNNARARGNNNGALLYFLQMECGYGIPCPPYKHGRAITCAICTK